MPDDCKLYTRSRGNLNSHIVTVTVLHEINFMQLISPVYDKS
jgi:hypothetical protein